MFSLLHCYYPLLLLLLIITCYQQGNLQMNKTLLHLRGKAVIIGGKLFTKMKKSDLTKLREVFPANDATPDENNNGS